jgi:lipoprotein-releasing system permease protein
VRAELHIARRYVAGLSRHTHVVTVSLISFASLALGVLALIVTLALLEGFQASIRHELVARATHARVRPLGDRTLDNADQLVSDLQGKLGEVELVQVVRGTCVVASAFDAVPASVIGRSGVVGVVVDQIVAARIGVGVGDSFELISPRQRLTPMGPLPVRARVRVDEVCAPEPGLESGAVFMPLDQAQRLLWGEPVVEVLEVRDPRDPWGVGQRLRRAVRDLGLRVEVEGLADLHRPLLLALVLERMVIFAAVGLMLVAAALNMLCNIAMIAAEKRTDLAVLAGLGLRPGALRRLFLLLGLGIGVGGAVTGAVFGVGLALALDWSELVKLPRDVFVVTAVPFKVDPVTVAAVVGAAIGLAAIASWLPARLVARREPAEGLRYE